MEQLAAALAEMKDPWGTLSGLGDRHFIEATVFGAHWSALARFATEVRCVECPAYSLLALGNGGTRQKLWRVRSRDATSALLHIFVDGTNIPAHPHAVGASHKTQLPKLWVILAAG
jgi:hypothetical protein